MRPKQAQIWLSRARFATYLSACEGDHEKAVALYNWNAEVSAAFLEVFHHVEVLLRNAVDRQFPATSETDPISVCRHDVWLTDPAIVHDASRERVNDAIGRICNVKKTPTRARVVAALSFGFWRSLFTRPYADLWLSHLLGAFPNGDRTRKQIDGPLARLLDFRNRVAHHEAVFSYPLERRHDQCLEIAHLIDSEARDYIAALSRVPALVGAVPIDY